MTQILPNIDLFGLVEQNAEDIYYYENDRSIYDYECLLFNLCIDGNISSYQIIMQLLDLTDHKYNCVIEVIGYLINHPGNDIFYDFTCLFDNPELTNIDRYQIANAAIISNKNQLIVNACEYKFLKTKTNPFLKLINYIDNIATEIEIKQHNKPDLKYADVVDDISDICCKMCELMLTVGIDLNSLD